MQIAIVLALFLVSGVQQTRKVPPASGAWWYRGTSQPAAAHPDLTGVFAAEFRDEQRDDSYSPSRQPSRGLEDENEAEAAESATQEGEGSINFFA